MAQLAHCASTGIPAVDAANDGLRFLLDRVFAPGVECRRGPHGKGECDFSRCSRIDAILRYIQRNFAHQEEVMADTGYPETQRHCDDHASLIRHLVVMREAHVCADQESLQVRDFIAHWAADHAKRCDASLGRWALTRQLLEPVITPMSS